MSTKKMAIGKMSTLSFLVFACALAGLTHGEDKDCSTDQVQVFSKMVTCITSKHPEYFMLVLTKMKNPEAMESPDFMCKEQGLMSSAVECLLEYVEGCMPSSVASQVAEVMPTHQTIKDGIQFLCAHRQDFDDPCVKSHLTAVGQCISSKMQSYSRVTRSAAPAPNMRGALCYALSEEEKCLDTSLAECPSRVTADITAALRAFFPSDKCPRRPMLQPQVLHFMSEGRH